MIEPVNAMWFALAWFATLLTWAPIGKDQSEGTLIYLAFASSAFLGFGLAL